MTEAELQAAIIDVAEQAGWLWYHVADSRRAPAGFPDLVLVRAPEVLFVECKAQRGRMSPEQRVWMAELDRVDTISNGVVRPDDLEALSARLLRRPPIGAVT